MKKIFFILPLFLFADFSIEMKDKNGNVLGNISEQQSKDEVLAKIKAREQNALDQNEQSLIEINRLRNELSNTKIENEKLKKQNEELRIELEGARSALKAAGERPQKIYIYSNPPRPRPHNKEHNRTK